MTDINKLRRLMERATPGPWEAVFEPEFAGVFSADDGPHVCNARHANAELIVAAVNALPDLLAELETLRRENAELLDEYLEYLSDAVGQGCLRSDGILECYLSTWADGIRTLAKHGRVRILTERGKFITAEFVPREEWPETQ